MADNEIDPRHGAGWLERSRPVTLQTVAPDTANAHDADQAWRWLDRPPDDPPPRRAVGHKSWPRRAGLTAGTALVVAAVLALTLTLTRWDSAEPDHPTEQSVGVATPPASTSTPAAACAGLSGAVVTDTAGDSRSMAGVIAAFEHAYYQRRDAEAALRLVAPEAGLVPEALAAGIASIPTGSTHCVAITPVAEATAEVHLVERHPDGSRIDYLQLINVRATTPAGGDLVISNIQKRG
ncbi:hypothetical protein ACWEKT_26535 [Nocardia takedensis]